jgi:hypothetical protein
VKTEQLILSIGTILLAARMFGWAFQRIGQPRVVGEMTAGILLGPSLFGRFLPGAFAFVFPSSSLPAIAVLSQLGLLLFMFVVGLEVDLKRILKSWGNGKTTELTSPMTTWSSRDWISMRRRNMRDLFFCVVISLPKMRSVPPGTRGISSANTTAGKQIEQRSSSFSARSLLSVGLLRRMKNWLLR